jgi:hypothetical protein
MPPELSFGRAPASPVAHDDRDHPACGVRKLDPLHQIVKDYIAFPALSGRRGFKSALKADLAASNVWAYAIIFCGHFPDQTYTFSQEEVADETKGAW